MTIGIRLFITVLLVFTGLSEVMASGEGYTVSGTVRNIKNKKSIEGASIKIVGTNIGTVTNDDGFFTLKVPDEASENNIEIENIGYFNTTLNSSEAKASKSNVTIWLTPATNVLSTITVRGGDPREIVEEAFRRVRVNYPMEKNLFSAFYRETVRKGRNYISVSEAIADVQKSSYSNTSGLGDKVQVRKGRRLMSQKASDTLAVKLVGGPTSAVVLDFVKNHDALFSPEELGLYRFKMLDPEVIDDRRHFVIEFSPVAITDYVMMEGVLYIDEETLSITRGEYKMNMSDKDKATKAILIKKPRGLRFSPQEASYIVTYKRDENDVTRLNYVSAKMRFKCDWKRRLFSSGYTTFSELVMVDREDNPTEGIARKNAFGRNDVFYDMVDNYWDKDFWNDYNIIEPSESLEKAVEKLKKKNYRTAR